LEPATRTTVADESAPLSMEITGAAAAASAVGLEIARSLLLLRGEEGSEEGLASANGAREAERARRAAREEDGEGSRAAAAAAQQEEGPRKSMRSFDGGRRKK